MRTFETDRVVPPASSIPLFDVTRVAFLRRAVGHAATALKVIGIFSAFPLSAYLYDSLNIVAVVAAFLASGCAFLIAKRLRLGSTWAAWSAAIWFVFTAWVFGLPSLDKLSKELQAGIYDSGVGLLMLWVPLYFLARGLIAFAADRAHRRQDRMSPDPLALNPYEVGLRIKKRPKFISKKSIAAYGLIILSPLPYLLMWGAQQNQGFQWYRTGAEALGAQIGILLMFLLMVVWGTRIYRRARRAAMLPGSSLIKKDTRPVVLYLRSFQDDSRIKLRARATNGRILPERLSKIPFEEVVTDHLWGYGPVLAIGNPQMKSKAAPLGAARDYADDSDWQLKVTELMQDAAMIVVVAGGTEGLAWEIDTIARLGLLWKLVLLLPPVGVREVRARWQALKLHTGSNVLPAQIDFAGSRAVIFPKGRAALITGKKRNDWTYEAVLDEAALMVARERDAVPQAAPSPQREAHGGRMRQVLGGVASDLATMLAGTLTAALLSLLYLGAQARHTGTHPYASPGAERDSFVAELVQVCQRDNANLSAEQLANYCACFSSNLADSITLKEFKKRVSDPTAYDASVKSVVNACSK